jgi:hypothetical protein
VLSSGDWIAITVALLASAVTVGSTMFIQSREDRRAREAEAWRRATEKRRRVEASFRTILLDAGLMEGMVGIFNWKRDDARTEEERADLYATIRRIQTDLQAAVASLTLEGITEPVEKVNEVFGHFTQFRYGLARLGQPGEPADLTKEMYEHTKEIARLRKQLDAELPGVLKLIEPDEP